ncbi:Acyl-coenzyme A thioesterase 1 [Bulinus truncatus]|nr:Acyl-coenzyme A thioesterase 1 [Bulinus truncatus]
MMNARRFTPLPGTRACFHISVPPETCPGLWRSISYLEIIYEIAHQNTSGIFFLHRDVERNGSGIYKNGSDIYKNGSGIYNNGYGIYNNGSDIYNNGSGIYKNGSGIYKNDSDIYKNGSGIYKNDSDIYNNGSGIYNNGSDIYNNGSAIYKNGYDIYKNGSGIYNNGSGIYNNGSGIYKNDSDIYKNGSGIYKNDSDIYNNGSAIYKNGPDIYNNGSAIYKNGSDIYNNGSAIYKNGYDIYKNGSGIYNNGSGIYNNGSGIYNNGCGIYKNYSDIYKNGSGIYKNNSDIYNNGSAIYKNGSDIYNIGSGIYNNGSDIYKNGSGIYKNDSDIYKNGSAIYKNGSGIYNNGSAIYKNGSDIYKNGSGVSCERLRFLLRHLKTPASCHLSSQPRDISDNSIKNFSIIVEPKTALFDENVKIHMTGLPPREKVTLHGEVVQGPKQIIFASCGHYVTDIHGDIDVTQHASEGGTYTGVEPMGVFWSMKPAPGQPPNTRMPLGSPNLPCVYSLRVYQDHLNLESIYTSQFVANVLASTQHDRWLKREGVTRVEVEDTKVRGVLFLPSGDGPFQGVIDMFGSRGGLTEYKGALLASHGFAVLCLPYFNYKDLPSNMSEMSLDYFEAAVNYMMNQPKISSKGLGVVAISKGVENAMSMGAFFPEVTAVVCINGYPYMTISDLVSKGQVLFKGSQIEPEYIKSTEEGLDICDIYPNPSEVLPIWQGQAKYLILQSLDDFQMKPNIHLDLLAVCPESKKKDIEIVRYPGAGHLLDPPYIPVCRITVNPTIGVEMKFGGYPREHAYAQVDAWQRTIQFLRHNIPSS